MNKVLLISVLLSIVFIAGGILVLLKDARNRINQHFFFIAFVFALWALAYSYIEIPESIASVSLLNKLSYVFALTGSYLTTWFSYYFPKKATSLIGFKLLSLITFLTVLGSFTPLIAGEVSFNQDGVVVFTYGLGTVIYLLVIAFGVLLSVRNLIHGLRHSTTRKHKSQIKYMLFGLFSSFIAGTLFGILLPYLNPALTLNDLAPFSVVFLLYFFGKAIIQKRLFDFRIVFSQSLAVFLTLSTAAVIYVFFSLIVTALVRDNLTIQSDLVTSVLFTILLVTIYARVKHFYEKTANKLLFGETYDPQTLLDTLNQSIVLEVEVVPLLEKTAKLMEQNLDTTFCGFYIRETAYFSSRFIANFSKKIPPNELEKIRQLTPTIHRKIHSTELEPDTNEETLLNEILKNNEIEIIGRLVSTLEYEVAGVGYLLLGTKRSGAVYSEQDLKVLEIIINELVIAVENALRLEEIEQFNVTLQKKIDDATHELRRSNDKLKALDEAKDEFVSMASHQLRTPLTSIKGYLSMVLDGDAGEISPTQKDMLGQAFFSSQRMVYLISDLLNVSRLKTGKFLIEAKPVYLPDVVESEIDQLRDGAKSKNLTIEYIKPESFSQVMLDEMKMRQVIMNFTDNAIYYTKSGGTITIALKETNKSVEFTVTDNGIGVPKEQQHKLFTKFYRAENARKARPDGTGLGLFMAKKVIIAQGGSLIFKSKENKGSTFGFNFPKDKITVDEQ